jgi:hypothetical protein
MRAKSLAQIAYEAYCKAVGGKAFNGDDLLDWGKLPTKIKDAWLDSAVSVGLTIRERDKFTAEQMVGATADLKRS